ncbi:hypothetical protein [Comamonas koreensis]|uniref:hypothetical protein n=1 Tax=Comamonas koreensis TaxID=160825 RepID=UPI0015F985AC|nr:hypothetical protein [Comamonas koreensis]
MEIAKHAKPGARYRVTPWNDISKPGAPLVGYGLSEKKPGERLYKLIAWKGEIHPWKTLATAREAVKLLNEASDRALQKEKQS